MSVGPMFTRLGDPRVENAAALIERSFHQHVTLRWISGRVNLSTSRLRHLFKEQIGMTPAQYIKFLRMRAARELADTTYLSGKQIMSRIGIADQSHFVRDFKSTYGITMTTYRRQQRLERCLAKSAKQ
jgi:AraC-like DNA-binding protein